MIKMVVFAMTSMVVAVSAQMFRVPLEKHVHVVESRRDAKSAKRELLESRIGGLDAYLRTEMGTY